MITLDTCLWERREHATTVRVPPEAVSQEIADALTTWLPDGIRAVVYDTERYLLMYQPKDSSEPPYVFMEARCGEWLLVQGTGVTKGDHPDGRRGNWTLVSRDRDTVEV